MMRTVHAHAGEGSLPCNRYSGEAPQYQLPLGAKRHRAAALNCTKVRRA